jgi:ribose 5-phosphate isomerase B
VRVAIGSDHAGFDLKERVKRWLAEAGYELVDVGVFNHDRADYPDLAHKVAGHVEAGDAERGVLVCGSGIGVCIVANKHKGVRAANCTMEFQAEMSRRHNDANVLCLGERVVGPDLAESLVKVFFTTGFDGGRHVDRVEKIDD